MLLAYLIIVLSMMVSNPLWAGDTAQALCSSSSDMSISSLAASPISSPSSSCSSLPGSPMQVRTAVMSPSRSRKIECCLGIPLLYRNTRDAQKTIAKELQQDADCGYIFNRAQLKQHKRVRFAWLGSMSAHAESELRSLFNEMQQERAQEQCGTIIGSLSFDHLECMQLFAHTIQFIQFVSAFTAAADKKGISHLALPRDVALSIYLGSLRRLSDATRLADVHTKLKRVKLRESELTIGDLCLYFEQDFEASDR